MNFDAYICLRTNPDLLRIRIQKRLREKQLTITKAERLSGMGCGSLRNFIAGHTKNPTLETLNALATTLELTLDQFLDFSQETQTEPAYGRNWDPPAFLKALESVKVTLAEKPMTILNFEEAISMIQDLYDRDCGKEAIGEHKKLAS
jgi:transcriptional regulator with XRE-family HTH domain